jgi:hypothetical protein
MTNPEKAVMSSAKALFDVILMKAANSDNPDYERLSELAIEALEDVSPQDHATWKEITALSSENHKLRAELQASRSALGDEGAVAELAAQQRPLEPKFAEVLHANMKNLYITAPAVKDALPGAEGPRFRKEMDEIEANISKYTVFSLFTLMRQYVNATPAVPAGEPVAWISQGVEAALMYSKADNVPAVLTTTRCAANTIPLFTRPSGAVPVAAIREGITAIKFVLDTEVGRNSDHHQSITLEDSVAALEAFLAGVKG